MGQPPHTSMRKTEHTNHVCVVCVDALWPGPLAEPGEPFLFACPQAFITHTSQYQLLPWVRMFGSSTLMTDCLLRALAAEPEFRSSTEKECFVALLLRLLQQAHASRERVQGWASGGLPGTGRAKPGKVLPKAGSAQPLAAPQQQQQQQPLEQEQAAAQGAGQMLAQELLQAKQEEQQHSQLGLGAAAVGGVAEAQAAGMALGSVPVSKGGPASPGQAAKATPRPPFRMLPEGLNDPSAHPLTEQSVSWVSKLVHAYAACTKCVHRENCLSLVLGRSSWPQAYPQTPYLPLCISCSMGARHALQAVMDSQCDVCGDDITLQRVVVVPPGHPMLSTVLSLPQLPQQTHEQQPAGGATGCSQVPQIWMSPHSKEVQEVMRWDQQAESVARDLRASTLRKKPFVRYVPFAMGLCLPATTAGPEVPLSLTLRFLFKS